MLAELSAAAGARMSVMDAVAEINSQGMIDAEK